MPTVFNAANERAVALFLEGRIGFTDIARLIRNAMDNVKQTESPGVDEILAAEEDAIRTVNGFMEK